MRSQEEVLGRVFVHGKGASYVPGSGVGNAKEVEKGLDGAVFSSAAMEDDEDDVNGAEFGTVGEDGRGLGAELDKVSVGGRGEVDLRVEEGFFFGGGEEAFRGVDGDDLVTFFPQSTEDLSATGDGDVAFFAGSAE